jgi:hypothetical protein
MVPISSIAVSTFKLTLQPIQRPLRFHKWLRFHLPTRRCSIHYITITTVDNITTYQGLSYSHRPCLHSPCIHQVFNVQVSTRKLNPSGEREGGFPCSLKHVTRECFCGNICPQKRFEELEGTISCKPIITSRIFIGFGESRCSDDDRKNIASACW